VNVIRQNLDGFRVCYEGVVHKAPGLSGTITLRFVVDERGAVSSALATGSTLSNPPLVACVTGALSKLSFPPPEGGIVTVTYSFRFGAPRSAKP